MNAVDTCAEIMIADPVTLPATTTVDEATDRMLRGRFHHMPVVDERDRFLGLFGVSHIAKLLLPRAVTMAGGLDDAGFVRESLADMNERLALLKAKPVLALAETKVRTVNPATPLIRGLQILYRERTLVPVVEAADGRLVGVLAFYGLLARLRR
jgi:CBS-domain-containing membrane protein